MIKHKYGKWIAFTIALIVLIFCIRSCEEHRNLKPVTKLENKRVKALNIDSINEANEAKIRLAADSVRQVYVDSLKLKDAQYDSLKAQDKAVVTRWRQAPNTNNGEAIIKSKDKIIKKAESRIKDKNKIIQSDSVKIASFNNALDNKNKTIAELNQGYQDALKLAAKKSKPKRWGVGAYVGYGVTTGDLKPMPSAGISINYNLIRF